MAVDIKYAQFGLSQDTWLPAKDNPRASRSFARIAGSGNEISKLYIGPKATRTMQLGAALERVYMCVCVCV